MEVALIKLCKPQMETVQDALIDRIRQVEEKVENGVVVEGGGNRLSHPGGTAAGAAAKPKPELPKAVPEDIKQIVTKWPAITGSVGNPMKAHLRSARLSLDGDNRLMVVLEDGPASDYFTKHTENQTILEELLSDFSGKKIEVNIQIVKGEQEFQNSYVDLSKVVQMDIEEEDEEPE